MDSRLDELLALRKRVNAEIVAEQRRERHRHVIPAPGLALLQQPGGPKRPPSRVVKEWAVKQGLIPAVVRARCPNHLYDAYAAAHPAAGQGRPGPTPPSPHSPDTRQG